MRNLNDVSDLAGGDAPPKNGHHADGPPWLAGPTAAERGTAGLQRSITRGLAEVRDAVGKQEEATRAVVATVQGVNAALHGDLGLVSRVRELSVLLERIAAALEVIAVPFQMVARVGRIPFRVVRRLRGRPARAPAPPAGPATERPALPHEAHVDELIVGRVVEQPFTCPVDCLSSVRLRFGTFNRTNYCSVTVAVLDEGGQAVREVTLPATRFREGGFQAFGFEPLDGARGRPLTLRVTSPDGMHGNAVSPWVRPAPPSGLTVDGKPYAGALVFAPCDATNDPALVPGTRDILIVCPDRIGRTRIGIGMRHWEVARALAARGLTVTLGTPHELPPGLAGDGFALHHLAADEVVRVTRRHRCVLVQGSVLETFPDLPDAGVALAVDLITPMHLENLEKSEAEFEHSRRLLMDAIGRGDFFVCGNERQRLHWLGAMTALGRVGRVARAGSPDLRRLIDVVPFGVPDAPPVKTRPVLKGVVPGIEPGDFVCTWFGGIWDWMDPAPIVRAVGSAWREDPRVKLFFSAYRTPDGNVPAMARRTRELAESLGLLGTCVFFNEYPVPFDERADYLLETDCGILCQAANLETQVSARTRVLDYLWADCPLVMNAGDEWAAAIREHDLGVILDGNDEGLWRDALLTLCRDRAAADRFKANIARFKGGLLWTRCVEPLYRFAMLQRSVPSVTSAAA